MKNPLFSLIIPTYNNREYLFEALDSVFKQTMDDYEILVIDDGSTDGTGDSLSRLVNDEKIVYIHQANCGPATARNTGIKVAKGQYLTFLDADDLLHPECLASIKENLLKHSDIGLIFTNYDIFFNGETLTESGVDIWKIFRTIPMEILDSDLFEFTTSLCPYIIRHGSFMHTSGLTIGKWCLSDENLFKEGYFYGEDDEFWARITYVQKAAYIDKVLSRKRVHSKSLANDHSQLARNILNQIDLCELQMLFYNNESGTQIILKEKLSRLAAEYSWHLNAVRNYKAARRYLLNSIKRHPLYIQLYKLLFKNIMCTPLFKPRKEGN